MGDAGLEQKRRLEQAHPMDQGSQKDRGPSLLRSPQGKTEISDLLLIHIKVIFFSLLQFIQVYGAHKGLQRRPFDVVMRL